jgi:hypothetical protein
MPEGGQILRERLEGALIDLVLGDGARVEGRQATIQLTDAFECGVPAGFEFRRDQAHRGIDLFVPTGGQLGVVARVFELESKRLSFVLMSLIGTTRGVDGGIDGRGRDRLQELGADRVLDGPAGA